MRIDSAAINHWMLRLDAVQPGSVSNSGQGMAATERFAGLSDAVQASESSQRTAASVLSAPVPDRPLDLAAAQAELSNKRLELGPELIDQLVERVLAELTAS